MPGTFERLNKYLMSLPDDSEAMMLEELDGFLAGVLACPDMIQPSQWLPHIWGRSPGQEMGADFQDLDEASRVLGLIMEHYNSIARALMPGSRSYYEPIVTVHEKSGEEMCFFWLGGFERALKAWPESWLKIMQSGNAEAMVALARLRKLIAATEREDEDFTEEHMAMLISAPDEISELVHILADWRISQTHVSPMTRHEAFKDVGRNDPCPCGSGRKYKKCHGAN